MLPGFEPPARDNSEPGYVETETAKQIDKLREMGYIQDHHAGQVALAIVTARQIDRLEGKGAASGQANLSRALKEVFEMLPMPEAATGDTFEAAVRAILAEAEEETTR
ncbi:hypothetical protein GCM10027033_14860 [Leucobacter ruminantium]